jgi:enterochelin esterase-like enzyme
MTRVAVALAVVWMAVGAYGVQSYGSHYYAYRGFSPPNDPPGVARGRLENVRFFSPALGSERRYLIYLPPGYDRASAAGKRFPVLYLLHGSPGFPALFLNAGNLGVAVDELVSRHAIRPMLVVMPGGSDGSFKSDTEWANTPDGPYESYVLDVVRSVDATFPTLARRADRAIAGDSEGAFGAANIALHNLRVFGVEESWSGYFVQGEHGPFRHAGLTTVFRNSPAEYLPDVAVGLRRHSLHAYIYTGNRDRERAQVAQFARELAAYGGRVRFSLFPGRHEWSLWRRETPLMLRFADRWFAPAPGPRVI